MQEIIDRVISKYDELIDELEKAHAAYTVFHDSALENKNVTQAEMDRLMVFAQINKRNLDLAKMERKYLFETYHIPNS